MAKSIFRFRTGENVLLKNTVFEGVILNKMEHPKSGVIWYVVGAFVNDVPVMRIVREDLLDEKIEGV